ncbi:GntR family transcriptional regulator [Clostridium bowmanii]|uniref:GntR family transcriptional regulator n=1 Tax=Clostridium bowmanii TaxID=132925 RepID=UPI001C0C92F1|nr:GntR family transcriptional regulator [Clostridium bowmanii]MBU3191787.1 GntR family transcriptional regulator [Clostridium bowmanii]MCA1075960.1 GntR family transcriptional regulator [Clostridium bowmanii]
MNIIISNSSQHPIYEQISTQIKTAIMKDELSAGDALPSIRSLAKELQISVITTKRSYEELEKDGFLETVPGKGSYVSGQNKDLIREKRLTAIDEKLTEVVTEGKLLNLSLEDLQCMLQLLYTEDN